MPRADAPVAWLPRSSRGWLRLAGGVAILILALATGRELAALVPAFAAWVRDQGALGPAVFMATYAAATIALVPGSLLTLAAGAVFGLFWGTVYVLIGATAGLAGGFLVSRYLAREAVERRLAGTPGLAALDRAIAREGGKIVFLLRLSPVFPFSILNYLLGLTRVRFRDYLLASVGILPGTILYTYTGKVAGDLAVIAAGGAAVDQRASVASWVLGLGATLVATIFITRLARRALAASTGVDSP